jgi:gamma-glutamyl phosphate reductase
MEEIKFKRRSVDEYTNQKKAEMKNIKQNLYEKYILAKEKMDEEREENLEMVEKYEKQIHLKNLKMVEMMSKFQRVKSISDRLKEHYATLRKNGFDVDDLQDCNFLNFSLINS